MRYISELPEPYKSLAENRREECISPNSIKNSDDIILAFVWCFTPEWEIDKYFWANVSYAKTEQELPPIPEEE